jgi:hypothetical protein
VAERWNPADREARRLANLVGASRPRALPELRRVDAPVAGAETDERPVRRDEDEGLDDLPDLGPHDRGSLSGGPRRISKLTHLDVEPEPAQPLLKLRRGFVERH